MITALSTGFLTSFALILAIGAQNAFVLKQGILKEHVFWVAVTCALSDAILIASGVAGFGAIVTKFPNFPFIMSMAGAAFLIFYGAQKFWSVFRTAEGWQASLGSTSFKATILTCLALTWLNPHVYLDTLGLIGAVSTQFTDNDKAAFGIGAVSASFAFFFGLAYGARFLAPIMQTRRTWQILDVLIGLLMWFLAYGLLTHS